MAATHKQINEAFFQTNFKTRKERLNSLTTIQTTRQKMKRRQSRAITFFRPLASIDTPRILAAPPPMIEEPIDLLPPEYEEYQ